MIKILIRADKRLILLLNLMAVHSLVVGIGLILHPEFLIKMSGFKSISEDFFPVQGGIFHVIMALGYAYSALDLKKHRSLVIFALVLKIIAAVFLIIYYVFMDPVPMVILSGLGDGLIAVLLYLCLKTYDKQTGVNG